MKLTIPYHPIQDMSLQAESQAKAGRKPNNEALKWVVVQETAGLLPARIAADSLQAQGIPALAWQESVGQAYGITIGPLGTGYVLVPAGWAAEARQLLENGESQSEDNSFEP